MMNAGERSAETIRQQATAALAADPGLKLEYFEICHPDTLQPLSHIEMSALIAAAMFLGPTRLIDNLSWRST
jgi:pantothenate synthetase